MTEKAKKELEKGIESIQIEIDKNLSKIIKDFTKAKESDINYFSDDTLSEIEKLKANISLKSGFEVILEMLEGCN